MERTLDMISTPHVRGAPFPARTPWPMPGSGKHEKARSPSGGFQLVVETDDLQVRRIASGGEGAGQLNCVACSEPIDGSEATRISEDRGVVIDDCPGLRECLQEIDRSPARRQSGTVSAPVDGALQLDG